MLPSNKNVTEEERHHARADRRTDDGERTPQVFAREKAVLPEGQSNGAESLADGNGAGDGSASQEPAAALAREEPDPQKAHDATAAHLCNSSRAGDPAGVGESG